MIWARNNNIRDEFQRFFFYFACQVSSNGMGRNVALLAYSIVFSQPTEYDQGS